MGRRKTREEIGWLLAHYADFPTVEGTADAFEERFGWRPPYGGLAAWASANGLTKAAARGHVRWTPEMRSFFRRSVPGRSESEIADLFEAEFGIRLRKSQVKNAKTTLGVRSGTHGGRFSPGRVPHNKGRTWDDLGLPEGARERMRATQFKRGEIPWNGARIPVGAERVDRDGYTWVKVAERPSRPDCNDNWRAKHRIVWEDANGTPVPDGCMVVFLDGDKGNLDPENLAIETLAEHAVIARSGIPYADMETHEAARAIARLKSAARRAAGRARGSGRGIAAVDGEETA